MKISVNDVKCFELSDTQKKVIKNDIHEDVFEADMRRRLEYILTHKYERCFERLKAEWMPKLQERVPAVPTDPDALAQLIFAQADYKCRAKREKEAKDHEHKMMTGQL